MACNDLVSPTSSMVLRAPANIKRRLELMNIRTQTGGAFSGFLKNIPWEQVTLPWLSRRDLLVNLCNIGPVLHPRSVTMIHDAQVYLTPASYGLGFRLWYKFIFFFLPKRALKILTVSEYSKAQLTKYGVAKAEDIEVIHNGADHVLRIVPEIDPCGTTGLTPGKFVLALANTQSHKNIAVLLKAFADTRLGDLKLALFGAATASDFQLKGHIVPPNVLFLGRISDERLTGLLKQACAFACPSTTEGFGLPPLEAMMLGCPVVVAPCGALPEVCGSAALYAEPGDEADWVAQLRLLADDPSERRGRHDAGLKHAKGFTWKKAARKFTRVLNELK